MNFILRSCANLNPSRFGLKLLTAPCKRIHPHIARYCEQSGPKNLGYRYISPKSLPSETVLYEINKSRYVTKLKLMAMAQYVIWMGVGFSALWWADHPPEQDEQYRLSRSINFLKYTAFASMIVGLVVMSGIWFYILRTVKKITLSKNGRAVILETYGPVLGHRVLHLPLERVSGVISRYHAETYFPLKVSGHWKYFLVDMKGNFSNVSLFDSTVAVKRSFKKT